MGIDLIDLADKAERLALLAAKKHPAVDAGKPDCPRAQCAEHMNKSFIDFSRKYHAHDFRRLFIGVSEAAHKAGLDAHTLQGLGDLRTAAVYQDDFDADELQKGHVAHDQLFERLVRHGVAAVFDDEDLILILLDIGHRLEKDLCLCFLLRHVL